MAIHLRFTERALRELPLATAGYVEYIDDTENSCLLLRVGVRDRTLYVRRKQRGTKRPHYGRLGVLGDKPLSAYRVEAETIAAQLARGEDPRKPKVAKGDALTFRGTLDGYLEAKGKSLAPGTVTSYTSDFEQTYGAWSSWPPVAVTSDRVLHRHHERMAESETRAVGALRVLRAVHRYTVAAAAADGKPIVWPDPLAKVRLTKALKSTPRRQSYLDNARRAEWIVATRALPDDEGQSLSGTARDALLLLIADGLRLREGLRLTWSEVDLKHGTITLSDKRKKGKREHVLPVPRRTLAMLAARRAAAPKESVYVFESVDGAPLDRISKWVYDAIGVKASAQTLRRTCSTWLGTNAPYYVVKQVLSHADPSKSSDVTVGYVGRDIDALRVWLQKWEDVLYAKGRK